MRPNWLDGVVNASESERHTDGMGDLKGYQRVTVKGILTAMRSCGVEDSHYEMVTKVARKSWESCWQLGHVLAVTLCAAINPYWDRLSRLFAKHDVWKMSTIEFVAWGKSLHERLVLDGTMDGVDIEDREYEGLLYIHNLSGRGNFEPKKTLQEEINERMTSSVKREHRKLGSLEYSRSAWKSMVKREIQRMVSGIADNDDMQHLDLDEFNKHIYRHVPSGSGVRLEHVAGFGKPNSRFTKRATLELSNVIDPKRKCVKAVSKPFLKREVSKVRWLYPLDAQATVRFLFLEHHVKQAMQSSNQCSLGKRAAITVARRLYITKCVREGRHHFVSDDA